MDFFKCTKLTAAAKSALDMVPPPLSSRRSFAFAAANSAFSNSRAAASADAAASESAFARIFACALMTTSELKAVDPQTIHRFFELMVPSRTSSAWPRNGDVGKDGTPQMCCCSRPRQGKLGSLCASGERLEISRIWALAASHGPWGASGKPASAKWLQSSVTRPKPSAC